MRNGSVELPPPWAGLSPEDLAALDERTLTELESLLGLDQPWVPFPGPQTAAVESQADELYFGGAAGGGKSFLLLGLALTRHRRSIIFRREYPQLRELIDRSHELIGGAGKFNAQSNVWRLRNGRVIEFGAVQHERDMHRYQGRPHDLLAFDELPHFTRAQYRFLMGWLRTMDRGQRCRVVGAGNPPVSAEQRWVIEEWAPWLDKKHPRPALPGELRWYAAEADKTVWLEDGRPFRRDGELVTPRSRTFIPARLEDNPVLSATSYRAVLQSLPEPLRSQLLLGDFAAGLEDDALQVVPTAWVEAAFARWAPDGKGQLPMTALGVDVAYGGDDQTVLAPRYRTWFDRARKHPGRETPNGQATAALVLAVFAGQARHKGAQVNIDAISWGSSAYDLLKGQLPRVNAIIFSEGSDATDRAGVLYFRNLRAEAWWGMREALDPISGDGLALPPDPELLADLTAPRWRMTTGGVLIEAKEEVKARIGRSPDVGDAYVLARMDVQTATAAPRTLGQSAPRVGR